MRPYYSLNGYQLMGRGIGFIDIHLLAATALASTALLWTADRRLLNAATELGLDYSPSDRN
jgi:predicted nucleic acid-binding protein